LCWRSAVVDVHDRARVRVTAHAFGLAAGGSVWWVPEVNGRSPTGSTARGCPRVGLYGAGPRRFGFAGRVRGWVVLAGGGAACGRRVFSGPSPHLRPEGSSPVRWSQAGSLLLWSGSVRLDTTGPACLGKPRRCGEGPRTQTLSMVRRIHRSLWPAQAPYPGTNPHISQILQSASPAWVWVRQLPTTARWLLFRRVRNVDHRHHRWGLSGGPRTLATSTTASRQRDPDLLCRTAPPSGSFLHPREAVKSF
jgi:hypothetical protein